MREFKGACKVVHAVTYIWVILQQGENVRWKASQQIGGGR